MTAPNATIDEMISFVRQEQMKATHIKDVNPDYVAMFHSICATLQSIKDAGDDVVEPLRWNNEDGVMIQDSDGYFVDAAAYDTLLSAYKRVCVERDEAAQMNDDQAMRIAKLESERERFRKDAERYRWINKQHHFLMYIATSPDMRRQHRLKCGECLDTWIDARLEEENAAIDSARNK